VSGPADVSINYAYTSRQIGQGFGFDYRLVSGTALPPAPIPAPAALPLLASALAGLGLVLRRRRRLAA
jgi:hypothetical protein